MGVILLAMTVGGLIIAAILLTISHFLRLSWLKTFVLGGVTVWLTGYAILLLLGSIFSEERTLDWNEPKEFCGFYLDCHMHAAVSNVKKTKTYKDAVADGEFYVVKVKVSSDAKRATLNLITPQFHVTDDAGKIYEPVENPVIPRPPFDDKVSAGESFEKEIVFDLPPDVENPRLDIKEGYGIDHAIETFLIGDEDSLFHKRIRFNLEPKPIQAGLN